MMLNRIESKLQDGFSPIYLKVEDESHTHNVPDGAQTHFKVTIVSDRFTGERLLQRHRQIYQLLSEEFAASLHAIALHTYTEKEWDYLNGEVANSPKCFGGSKAS